ncbi:MAG: spore germination protein [Bacillota bacterium]|nr:spore germination protein [Bacillota bacterium]
MSSFTVPVYSVGVTVRLARFPLMLLAGSTGLFGIVAGLSLLLIHLWTLRSFGVPYLEPFAPLV